MKPVSPASANATYSPLKSHYVPIALRMPPKDKTVEILCKNREWVTKLLSLIQALEDKIDQNEQIMTA